MCFKITELSELNFPEEFFCDEIRNGFYVSETMKRHWAATLKVLSEIDNVCRKHNLNWYADSGTLIGTIRHKGFIPWDDDIDIAMFRDDFELFLQYAKDEFPEDYVIQYNGENGTVRSTFKVYYNPFANIVNGGCLSNDKKFLDENFGYPLLACVDIFPLDRVFNDENKEKDRIQRGNLVYTTLCGIKDKKFTKKEIEILLPIIEKDNKCKIDRKNAVNDLLRVFREISIECKDEDSTEVALMYVWVENGKCKYNKNWYDSWKEYQFENTRIRVPSGYHEILSSYYGNYMKIVKGGAVHEFPIYRKLEKVYWDNTGKYPLRYALDKQNFKPISRENKQQKIIELFSLVTDMHSFVQNSFNSNDNGNFGIYLQSCQEAAISIGNFIENEFGNGTDAVTLLELYCEKIYEASNNWTNDSKAELDSIIYDASEKAAELFGRCKRNILFLPCKVSWWESMRDVYEKLESDKRNNVKVIPLPYYYHDHIKMIGEMHRDSEAFEIIPELYGKITNFDEYDLEKNRPDIIVIQYPYDGNSTVLGIPELVYSANLTKYTDTLVYVPFLNPDPPEAENDVASKILIELVEQPAVFNSDYVIVGSKKLRNYYIETLVKLTDKKYQDYWEKRICTKEKSL